MEKKAEVLMAMMNCGKTEIDYPELLKNVSFNVNVLKKTLYQLRHQSIVKLRQESAKGRKGKKSYYSIKDMKNAKYYLRRNGIPIADDNTS